MLARNERNASAAPAPFTLAEERPVGIPYQDHFLTGSLPAPQSPRGVVVTRVRIGFDISQLLHEFVVLPARHPRRCRGARHPAARPRCASRGHPRCGDFGPVQAYVAARDYDARRRQAEHIGFLTHELRNPLAVVAGKRWPRSVPAISW
jgi:signal transduction histidine kinase